MVLIKTAGKVPVARKPSIDDDNGRLVIEGQVVKTETLSHQDDSVNLVFVVKPIGARINEG